MTIIRNSIEQINTPSPADPHRAAEFDQVLNSVHEKYRAGTPLTRRELLRLAQCCITIAEREAE